VSAAVRRRRGLLLLALALACGGLAAAQVRGRVESVERRVGPLVPVAVAARDVPAGARLDPSDVAVRRVPAAYVPRGALPSPGEAAGQRLAAPLAAGDYLTRGLVAARAGGSKGVLRRGERAVEVAISGGRALEGLAAGARVDVVVSTEPRDGAGRTFLALEGVDLLALRPADGAMGEGGESDGAAAAATAVATLRVTLRQAVYLAAAQNFAREVRLLPRPPGDRRRAGRAAIGAGDL
jgi:pilus assembly protein CpaB